MLEYIINFNKMLQYIINFNKMLQYIINFNKMLQYIINFLSSFENLPVYFNFNFMKNQPFPANVLVFYIHWKHGLEIVWSFHASMINNTLKFLQYKHLKILKYVCLFSTLCKNRLSRRYYWQKQPPKVFRKKSFCIFHKIHRKSPVPESLSK